jgi:hypothetical protein
MIDTKICPFCKKPNFCKADFPNERCWCVDIEIPKELIALVPKEFLMKTCICQKCVEFFKKDKEEFIKKYS